jgi:hypothetical protein
MLYLHEYFIFLGMLKLKPLFFYIHRKDLGLNSGDVNKLMTNGSDLYKPHNTYIHIHNTHALSP